MPDVFLSYARADSEAAERLSDRLRAEGLSVFDDRALVAGEDFSRSIKHALTSSKAVVVLLSGNSGRSTWVQEELRTALESRKHIIPVLLDPEATENWVWPLVSDRQAVRLVKGSDVGHVVSAVTGAVGLRKAERWAAQFASALGLPPIGLQLLISILSGLVGFLLSWVWR